VGAAACTDVVTPDLRAPIPIRIHPAGDSSAAGGAAAAGRSARLTGVPTSPEPADSAPPSVMPASARVAAITMGVLAALLLMNAGLTWYAYGTVIDRLLDEATNVTRAQAERTVRVSLVLYLVLGLLLALAAWFLPRRHPWARWTGLATSAALGLLTLFWIITAGGVSAGWLLLLVLSIAAVTSLLARTTGTWVPRLRSRD
jgi:glucan phosphoethanolaminetransferase (alkaline phosphatase superfamily)